MSKKRKTLPDDIFTVFNNHDFEAFKAVFEKCEINAYDRSLGRPALSHYDIPIEFMRWLIEQGADINIKDKFGNTPLHKHAYANNIKHVNLLLDMGADINVVNNVNENALFSAENHLDMVKLLLERGITITKNPMHYILRRMMNTNIADGAKVCEFYLNHGLSVDEISQEQVKRIGENFEFHRSNFNPELLPEKEQGLNKLYELFKVKPIAKRVIHDGVSDIIAIGDDYDSQFNFLWDYLIPSSGKAKTMQGEFIRIAGRVNYELMVNGGVNWNNEFKQMLKSTLDFAKQGNPLNDEHYQRLEKAVKSVYNGVDDEKSLDELYDLSVIWVNQNPKPILLNDVEYKR